MKKKILGIQIIHLIFCGLLFTIALLQKNNIIGSDKRLITIYIISILLYWIVMSIFIIVLMHKNKDEEKKLFINLILITIELLVLGIFCGSIDIRIDKIEFMKHCKETTATVYDITKKQVQTSKRVGEPEKVRYETTYDYYFEYYANDERYSSFIYEVKRGYSTERASYKIGDTFSIYYNTENPEDYRRNINYVSQTKLYVMEIILLILVLSGLGKAVLDYRKANV